ncbi:helix-turn-helix domain-containing protein [Bacteroides xylanisolvens]|uniref:helix-turn-helix domain-containing protein n=1 Tax=Bacteroides xylanisolvens TaxID=371601 RepID=UPI0039B4095D
MNTVTEKMPCRALETAPQLVETGQDKRNWSQCSRAIAAVMSRRMSELGLTQRMLAERMDCTQQYISKVLKGQKNMSLETLCKIENALDIEIIKDLDENGQ